MIIFPCAKINLGLNVVSRRADGYHNLETVFYPVNISDRIEITVRDGSMPGDASCTLTVEGMPVAGNSDDNLVVKAYNILAKDYILPDVNINLCKRIPMQAGMGGGSSDCAFTIRLLNDMFSLGISTERMIEYAASLGADCAFFINPVPAYAEGIGDVLQPLDIDLSGYRFLIVKPDIAVSTRDAFSLITPAKPSKCCRDILKQPIETWRHELVNDFEKSIFALHPEIATIKERLYGMGAIYASMSGSGSALFGIFKDIPQGAADAFKGCFVAAL